MKRFLLLLALFSFAAGWQSAQAQFTGGSGRGDVAFTDVPLVDFHPRFTGGIGRGDDAITDAPLYVPASALALITQPSAAAQSGVAFSQQPVVEVRNAAGNPVLVAGTEITAAIASGSGTLGGSTTVATDASGRATFTDLALSGTAGDYTLSFSSGALTVATSNTISLSIPQRPFITTWRTTTANESITLFTGGGESITDFNATIDWGDGTIETVTGDDPDPSHSYASAGDYEVRITGVFPWLNLQGNNDQASVDNAEKLVLINQWGEIEWESMRFAFMYASNMQLTANDTPDLSNVTDLFFMFHSARTLNADLSNWNVSNVTTMNGMFQGASSFNGDLSTWDVSSVIVMSNMFNGASSFNQDLSTWDVSQVRDIDQMFRGAVLFNGDISDWNVANVTNMTWMFEFASAFNSDISAWDVSNVFEMRAMFANASSFNQDLSDWNVARVTNFNGFMSGSGINSANYDSLLTGWSQLDLTNDLTIDFGEVQYSAEVAAARQAIIDQNNWTINDGGQAQRPFITTWRTTSANESITLYTSGGEAITDFNATIDWGDGTVETVTGDDPDPSHSYAIAGDYEVRITGFFPWLNLRGTQDQAARDNASKLQFINQWGEIEWESMQGAFMYAANMQLTATDAPILSQVSSLRNMFNGASSLNADLSSWDVSSITNMYGLFYQASAFNGNISTWNVSAVTEMSHLFQEATSFNGDITAWNVSAVTNMYNTFTSASAFNQDLSSWDVSAVTNMFNLFNGASAFDQDLGSWNVASVGVFNHFTQNSGLSNANYDSLLIGWSQLDLQDNISVNFGQVKYTDAATTARQAIIDQNNWTITDGGQFRTPFYLADNGVTVVCDEAAVGETGVVNGITYTKRTKDQITPANAATTCTSGIVELRYLFNGLSSFNEDISSWDVSDVKDMERLFAGARTFNQDISAWSVDSVEVMKSMFEFATSFNSNIGSWNVSSVTNMKDIFLEAASFNQNISNWDVSSVTDMSRAFLEARSFNQPIGTWDVSNVTNMGSMFSGASNFTSDLSGWNVSSATNMAFMFAVTDDFTSDLNNWDVSKVTTMHRMFVNAKSFNGNISSWDVSTVQDMDLMFAGASSFNQNLSSWCVSQFQEIPERFADQATSLEESYHPAWGICPDQSNTQPIATDFVTEWIIPTDNRSLQIETRGGINMTDFDAYIFWGDGSIQRVTSDDPDPIHTYNQAGTYEIIIRGIFPNGRFGGTRISKLKQWGSIPWESMEQMFGNASNMINEATDIPNVAAVTSTNSMFAGATNFNANLTDWDVSKVRDMFGMFRNATSFNGDISDWDVSSVIIMSGMFEGATTFNGDLSSWNVSAVTDMGGMFKGANAFNGDLSSWNVSAVTNMSRMFEGASAFDQNLGAWNVSNARFFNNFSLNSALSTANYDSLLLGWSQLDLQNNISVNFGQVKYSDAATTARQAIIDQNNWTILDGGLDERPFITTWRTTSANESISLYTSGGESITDFNATIDWGDGTVESITGDDPDPSHTYAAAGVYEVRITGIFPWLSLSGAFDQVARDNAAKLQLINQWGDIEWESMEGAFRYSSNMQLTANDTPELSSVTDMSFMFSSATSFNGDLSAWDVSNVTDMRYMFQYASTFNQDLSGWNIANVTSMNGIFDGASAFNSDLSTWDVSKVTNMSNMFRNATAFNADLSAWQVGNVTNMSRMFYLASSFTSDLSSWDVSKVTNMSEMFAVARNFNSDLNTWDVSNVTNMGSMFFNATTFNGNISNWDVSNVTNMDRMFSNAGSFNQDISAWNVSKAVSLENTFFGASSFNQDLSTWDVSNVRNMSRTFYAARVFSADLSNWNVASVTDMKYMFYEAAAFNADLSGWDVSSVTDMNNMFKGATLFNANLSLWDVNKVENMDAMFLNAISFSQDLSQWCVSLITTVPNQFASNSNLTTEQLPVWGTCPPPLQDARPFITTWHTQSAGESITIPTQGGAEITDFNFTIDWGDGTTEIISGDDPDPSHTYAVVDTFQIQIRGRFPWFYGRQLDFNSRSRLLSVDQWGDIEWESMKDTFYEIRELDYKATDIPNLNLVRSLDGMFLGVRSLEGNLGEWDVSLIQDMQRVFNRVNLAVDLSNWDISNVTTMNSMFTNSSGSVGDITGWNTSNVQSFSSTFSNIDWFNQDISNWDVSNATTMYSMFRSNVAFNQDISNWNVSKVTTMAGMFNYATSFNQNLSNWDVSQVREFRLGSTNIHFMEGSGLSQQNYDSLLIGWSQLDLVDNLTISFGDIQYSSAAETARQQIIDQHRWRITDGGKKPDVLPDPFITTWRTNQENESITIYTTFVSGSTFDATIDWGDGTVETISGSDPDPSHTYATAGEYQVIINGLFPSLFLRGNIDSQHPNTQFFKDNASKLVQINQWGDGVWRSMNGAFMYASNLNIVAIDTPNVAQVNDMSYLFSGATNLNADLKGWDVSGVTTMSHLFADASQFSGDISDWDVSNVTNMSSMFSGAASFNRDLSSWDVASVTNMSGMFSGAASFNGNLSSWNVSSVTNMSSMFAGTTAFNGDISSWDVASVTNMNSMFFNASAFNQNLSGWDVSAVTNMRSMFFGASSFNSDLSAWNTAALTTISGMFQGASAFSSDLRNWDIAAITDLSNVFNGASNFNGDLSGWDVSSVTTMESLFENATAFNQDLSAWDVSAVTNMTSLFRGAESFNQPLANWDVSGVSGMSWMFNQATDFDQNLGNWDVRAVNSLFNITVGSGLSTANYDSLLIGWSQLDLQDNRQVNFGDVKYSEAAIAARQSIIDQNNWAISDGGQDFSTLRPFITTWRTITDNESITLYTSSTGGQSEYNATIDWGDGSIETISGADPDPTHTYANAGDYEVQINGIFPRLDLANGSFIPADMSEKLVEVAQWGDINWENMEYMFIGAENMQLTATDAPRLANVQSIRNMFDKASSFNADLSSWDVSNVTNMAGVFFLASSFNGDVSTWDVSSVTDMNNMFSRATAFNGDLSNWDVSSVTIMNSMFNNATSFNGNLSSWDVSSVTSMASIFDGASAFNGDISNWNVSSLTGMSSAFRNATLFNQDLSAWNVATVTDMRSLFYGATSFNQDLSAWDVSAVTRMGTMFFNASAFDQNLGNWDVRNVTDFSSFAQDAGLSTANYDSLLLGWSQLDLVDNVRISFAGIQYSQAAAAARQSIIDQNNWTITDAGMVAPPAPFITVWRTSEANESISILTHGGTTVTDYDFFIDWGDGSVETITGDDPDPSHNYTVAGDYEVKISGTFPQLNLKGLSESNFSSTQITQNAAKLIDIKQWGAINWQSMAGAFSGAINMQMSATDTPDLSNVSSMQWMFQGTRNFSSDLNNWDISNVTNIDALFNSASGFNGAMGNWDISGLRSLNNVFFGATAFNQDLSGWDVSNITSMQQTFASARAFNQDLSGWDVSNVTTMQGLFNNATAFNQDLSSWDVSNVTNMSFMFRASGFNQDISAWDVSNVTNMSAMFNGASLFDQNLGSWNVSKVSSFDHSESFTFMDGAELSTANYDSLLLGWSQLDLVDNLSVNFGDVLFSNEALFSKAKIRRLNNWTISDGGRLKPDLDFELSILISDEANQDSLIIGFNPNATDGFDTSLDAYAPPAPPAGIFDVRILQDSENYRIQILDKQARAQWALQLKAAENQGPLVLRWNNETVASYPGRFVLEDELGGAVFSVNMKTTDQFTLPNGINRLNISYTEKVTLRLANRYNSGWNLIGKPVLKPHQSYTELYNQTVANSLFSFEGRYLAADSLRPGKGYWLRFAQNVDTEMEGEELDTLRIDLKLGWNLISGPSSAYSIDKIGDPSGLIIQNSLFGFNGRYTQSDSIVPGQGYWIRSRQEGTIQIPSSSIPVAKEKLNQPNYSLQAFKQSDEESSFSRIQFKGFTVEPVHLFFGSASSSAKIFQEYTQLPPTPPAEVFDIRLAEGYQISSHPNTEVLLQGLNQPLEMRIQAPFAAPYQAYKVQLWVEGSRPVIQQLNSDEPLILSEKTQKVVIETLDQASIDDQPLSYQLEAAYPNPFNPTTTIGFALPESSQVRLEVFNIQGQRVATLVNERMEAGRYQRVFNAQNLASGVYIYRIQANGFVQTRKLVLMK